MQLPGGKPNKNETYLQTIVREVAEETGINTDSVSSQYKFFGYYDILETDNLKMMTSTYNFGLVWNLVRMPMSIHLHQQNEDEEQNAGRTDTIC